MRLLAIDTALDACSAAVLDGDRVLASACEDVGRGHAEILMAVVARVLAEAGLPVAALDRFAVTIGPGSFTGIRVGLAAARGMALAAGRPVIGVGTLEALAADAFAIGGAAAEEARPVFVAVDARRGEVYGGLFARAAGAVPAPLGPAAAWSLADAAALARRHGAALVGSGAALVADLAADLPADLPGDPPTVLSGTRFPSIAAVARIAAARDPAAVAPKPLYLRAADAKPQEGFRIPRATASNPPPDPPDSREARP